MAGAGDDMSMGYINQDPESDDSSEGPNLWAEYFENLEARKDPAWNCDQTSPETCLTYLPQDHLAPAGVEPIVHGDPQSFLQSLRTYALETVEPELLAEREHQWSGEPVEGAIPGHIFLRGQSRHSQTSFHGWVPIITEDLGCDRRAMDSFVKLYLKNPQGCKHGYNEGCRIVAHALKDKIKPLSPLGPQEPENWSRYFKKCCEEAIEALDNWEYVHELPKKGHHSGAPQASGYWNYYPEDPSSSSKGKGKGKGKGTYIFEGLRE